MLLTSCGTGSDQKEPSTPPKRQSLNQRFASGGRDPNSFKQGADGKLEMNNDKRSQFENQREASASGKNYQKKEYRTGDYAKKSWWGNKDYDRKSYAGPTDGSRFQTTSRLDGQGAPEAGSQARIPDTYDTESYATGDAREAGSVNRDNAIQAREEGRTNDQFQWGTQRDLSVDQSRSMLGR
jgi:hypothetical protein